MKLRKSFRLTGLLVGALILGSYCFAPYPAYALPVLPPGGVHIGVEVYPNIAPPAPIQEETIISPGPGFIWIPGTWVWNDQWVWERGRWERPPHHGAKWVAHHYEFRKGRHVFVHGGWR